MGRFHNLDPFQKKGPMDILRWKVLDTISGKRRKDRSERFVTPRLDNDGQRLHSLEPSLTWIGHATFVLRLGGLLVATDPIWSDRIGPTVRRNTPPGVALESLPPIDVVTLSHAHYDHLDLPTLKAIVAHNARLGGAPPTFLVPTAVSRYLEGLGRNIQVIERAWWEDHALDGPRGGVTFSLVPQQHWSMRTPFDRDEALWGGWVMKSREGTAYHAGDTGYFTHFGDIGRRKGPIDWAMLPIGAYDPQWMMKPQHMGPEEAGRAFVELGAKILVSMHWGTFQLTDEPLSEPPVRIAQWWEEQGPGRSELERLWTLAIGETRALE